MAKPAQGECEVVNFEGGVRWEFGDLIAMRTVLQLFLVVGSVMGTARHELELVVLTLAQRTTELSVRLVVQMGMERLVEVVPGKMKEEKVPLFEVG